jgi:hypothetical protein
VPVLVTSSCSRTETSRPATSAGPRRPAIAASSTSVTRPQNGLAGQAATFRLRVVMDDAVNTSFFFDNLSFVANLCP